MSATRIRRQHSHMRSVMRVLRKYACLTGIFWAVTASGSDAAPGSSDAGTGTPETETQPVEVETGTPRTSAERMKPAEETEPTETVHQRRMSQLRRLRDLAVENDRPDMISRADGLISRELKRHSTEREQRAETIESPDLGDERDDAPSAEADTDNTTEEPETTEGEPRA